MSDSDLIGVRTGHARRLDELSPWDRASAKVGLHPSCAPFLADRRIAALGSDSNSDTAPNTSEGVAFPIHALALAAMGPDRGRNRVAAQADRDPLTSETLGNHAFQH